MADPCSIETAINSALSGDDVTLLGGLPPAPYTTSTALVVPANVTVHGTIGARPVIETDVGVPGVELNVGSVLRDVIVEFSGVNSPTIRLSGGGTLERVTGVATAASGSASGGCATFGPGTYLIRDSVCWHGEPDGLNGGGIEARNQGATDQTLVLRNVTAVTSNTRPGVRAIATAGGDVTVNATNVIAQSATGEDVEVPSGFGGHINLDHSNYDSEDDPQASPGLITDPGTGTSAANQITPPDFVNAAAGDFHQLPTSTGTIDLGTATGVLPGELDFDGQPRVMGADPDIGADELRRQTSTEVACTPPSLTLGAGSSTCTATVTDTGAGPTAPSGDVNFSSNGSGTFSTGGACTLVADTGSASCQLTYTPSAVGTGSHQITGTYAGDLDHGPSQAAAVVSVLSPPELTLALRPKKRTTEPGRKVTYKAVVINSGGGAAQEVEICVKPTRAKGEVRARGCKDVGTLAGGGSAKKAFKVKATDHARGRYRIKFTAKATNADKVAANAKLKVAG